KIEALAEVSEPNTGQSKASSIRQFFCDQGPGRLLVKNVETGVIDRVADGAAQSKRTSCELLPDAPLPAEADFYSQYRWCLDACPVLQDVLNHLSAELAKLDQIQETWRQSEVITNIFLL